MKSSYLSDTHKKSLLKGSSIAQEVIDRRGYFTATKKSELQALGFPNSQATLTPALVIPCFSCLTGEVETYQLRPDNPRVGKKDGKVLKYETRQGTKIIVDVHPFVREQVRDPQLPLFITEGVKKGDSLVSRKLTAISLLGVWNWRGTNEHGGKTALPEWDYVAIEDREIYLVFDSDVMVKESVHRALERVSDFLSAKGGKVRFVYLPPGDHGEKQGVDDFLASGKTMKDIFTYARAELKPPNADNADPEVDGFFIDEKTTPQGTVKILKLPGKVYSEKKEGLFEVLPNGNETIWKTTQLTNFTARIVGDIEEDDGVETKRVYELEARLNGGKAARFKVNPEDFSTLGWAGKFLGAESVIFSGNKKDCAREAIQLFSIAGKKGSPQVKIQKRKIFTHTGWRDLDDGQRVYLHAGGAIGATGSIANVEVSLPNQLQNYCPNVPAKGQIKEAIAASLEFLELGPEKITYPLYAAIWRAVLGDSNLTVHLAGKTGSFKSSLAALCAQHFGHNMDREHLPGNWDSTANSNQLLAFTMKDALLVVDDFILKGSGQDVHRKEKQADDLIRSVGNRAGRNRLTSYSTLQTEKYPRALILSTGEDIPSGKSLRARMLILWLKKEEIDVDRLTLAQEKAREGLYEKALGGFLQWLAGQKDLSQKIRELQGKYRADFKAEHPHTTDIIGSLLTGLRTFLEFSLEVRALSADQVNKFYNTAVEAFKSLADGQSEYQQQSDPVRAFINYLSSSLAGGRAHVKKLDFERPTTGAEFLGWGKKTAYATLATEPHSREIWEPRGDFIGWIDEEEEIFYLLPDAALGVVRKLAAENGEVLAITKHTLFKMLREDGKLVLNDENRNTYQKRVGEERVNTLAFLKNVILSAKNR